MKLQYFTFEVGSLDGARFLFWLISGRSCSSLLLKLEDSIDKIAIFFSLIRDQISGRRNFFLKLEDTRQDKTDLMNSIDSHLFLYRKELNAKLYSSSSKFATAFRKSVRYDLATLQSSV